VLKKKGPLRLLLQSTGTALREAYGRANQGGNDTVLPSRASRAPEAEEGRKNRFAEKTILRRKEKERGT